jgi:hypothetical protein
MTTLSWMFEVRSALRNFLLSEPAASSILVSERHARTRRVPSLPGLY